MGSSTGDTSQDAGSRQYSDASFHLLSPPVLRTSSPVTPAAQPARKRARWTDNPWQAARVAGTGLGSIRSTVGPFPRPPARKLSLAQAGGAHASASAHLSNPLLQLVSSRSGTPSSPSVRDGRPAPGPVHGPGSSSAVLLMGRTILTKRSTAFSPIRNPHPMENQL